MPLRGDMKAQVGHRISAADRLATVAHDCAALRRAVEVVARIDTIVVGVQRAAVVTQFVSRHEDVVLMNARQSRIREKSEDVADHRIAVRPAQRIEVSRAAVRQIATAGQELSQIAVNVAHHRVPVLAKRAQRTRPVEQIVRCVPQAYERQDHPRVHVAQIDVTDHGVELDHISRRGIEVAEQLIEFIVGLDGQLDFLSYFRQGSALTGRAA